MENRKEIKISLPLLILIIVLIIVGAVVIFKITHNKNNGFQVKENNLKIEYITSIGYGAIEDTEPVTIVIDSNEATIFYKKLKKTIRINKESYLELTNLINAKFFKLKSDLSNNNVLDGGSDKITVTNKNTGGSYTVGGYGVSNDTFYNIEEKIYETIGGYEIVKNFRKTEMKKYLNSNKNY